MRPLLVLAVLGLTWMAQATGLPAQAPSVPASAYFDSAQLLRDMRTLSADDMEGRQMGTRGGEKARAFVVSRLRASGAVPLGQTFLYPFTATGRGQAAREGVNVIGQIRGTRAPERFIVMSGHYDHVGIRNGTVFNGADDNASGVAALFAIAKYFADHRPSHSLLIAAFDGEEAGLLGSRAFIRSPPVDLKAVAIDLTADMIGRDDRNTLYVVGTRRQPLLLPPISRVAARAAVKLVPGHEDPAVRADDWTQDSDHWPFIEAGIPALLFSVEDEANHHKSTDDYETMTFDFYVRSVDAIIDVIKEFDQR